MASPAFVSSLRRHAPELLLQIFVLVTGITLSFALNEWRTQRGDWAMERHRLEGLHADLVVDSTRLARYIGMLGYMTDAYSVFLDPAAVDSLPPDTLDRYADLLITYAVFTPLDNTYEEMRQTGTSRLIANRELLAEVVGLYNTGYQLAQEWSDINRRFVLERMIPYVDEHGPYVDSQVTGVQWQGLHAGFLPLLQQSHFRNLVRTNRLFKLSQLAVFEQTLARVRGVIAALDAELER